MKVIEPFRYVDKNVFDEEARKIFGSQWLYMCLTDDVSAARDHVVVEIMGRSIIIYNNGKTLKAFQNVCPHRFNRIFTEEKGNGPLVCKYHSWAYDGNGKLIGKDRLQVSPNPENHDICLKEYPLQTIGKFVFVHLSATPAQSLEDQLGELVDELVLISNVLGEQINEQFIPHEVNWKFIIENVIEFNHCKSIHQETLVKSGFCSIAPQREKVNHNSYAINPCLEDQSIKKRHSIFNKYLNRQIVNNDFKHTLFFPNFTLAVFEGVIITIGQVLPISPGVTNYKLRYYFTALTKESAVGNSILDDLKQSSPEYNDKVFYEDKVMLEQLQKGVAEAEGQGFIYESEQRVVWFSDSYFALMKD